MANRIICPIGYIKVVAVVQKAPPSLNTKNIESEQHPRLNLKYDIVSHVWKS